MKEENVINTWSGCPTVSSSQGASRVLPSSPYPHLTQGKLTFQGHKANVGVALMSLRAGIKLDAIPCMVTAIFPELSDQTWYNRDD